MQALDCIADKLCDDYLTDVGVNAGPGKRNERGSTRRRGIPVIASTIRATLGRTRCGADLPRLAAVVG